MGIILRAHRALHHTGPFSCRAVAGLVATAGLALAGPLAHAESLGAAMKQSRLPRAALGAIILPVEGGPPLLAVQADASMNPASVMKLVTSFAGLELLGPAWQWKTEFWSAAPIEAGVLRGDLYLKGYGDPALSFDRYWLLLRALQGRGVRRISGQLVLDRSYFGASEDDDNPFDDSPERAYNVAPDALLINFKALRFDMESSAQTVSVAAEPSLPNLSVTHRFKLVDGPCENWRGGWQRPDIDSKGERTVVTLRGNFPRNCRASRYLGLFDPPRFADLLTRSLWTELGGSLEGITRQGNLPADARLLARQESPPLSLVLHDINKWSNNTQARALFLTLGVEHGSRDQPAAQAAQTVVRQALARRKLNFPELVLENGSGLSRSERISPRHMAEMLVAAWHSPFGPELVSSLPVLGTDGTLRKRFSSGPLKGQGHLKTGTLDDVKSIAGYVRAANGKVYALAGFINHPDAERGVPVLDALIETAWRAEPTVLDETRSASPVAAER